MCIEWMMMGFEEQIFSFKIFINFFPGLLSHVPVVCGVPGEEAAEDGEGGGEGEWGGQGCDD